MNRSAPILFIDIETVPVVQGYEALSPEMQALWDRKASYLEGTGSDSATLFQERGGIYAEFGKVIVAGLGIYQPNASEGPLLRVGTLSDEDEPQLLRRLHAMIEHHQRNVPYIGGHNIKEFDIPYICRRMLVNGMQLPAALDVAGKKPWEVNYIDTMELWKFGDRKAYTSLDLLAHLFHIPSSKSDIDGSQVAQVYYQEGDLLRIAKYCEQDVVVTAQVYRKLMGLPLMRPEQIEYVTKS